MTYEHFDVKKCSSRWSIRYMKSWKIHCRIFKMHRRQQQVWALKMPLLSLPPSTKQLSFLSLVAAGWKQPLILGLLFNQMFAMSFGTFREKSGVLSTTTINSNGPKEAHRLCTVCSAFTEICLYICYENSRRSPRVVHLPYSSFKSPGALKMMGIFPVTSQKSR